MTQKGIQVIYNTEVVKAETQPDDTCLLYTMDGGIVHVNSVLWCVEVRPSIVCIHPHHLTLPKYMHLLCMLLCYFVYRSGGRLIMATRHWPRPDTGRVR